MRISRLVAMSAALLVAGQLAAQTRPPASGSGAPQGSAAQPATGNPEHGQYLVERVVMCYECHSARDAQGNIVPKTKFMGGPMPVRPPWAADWPVHIPRIAGLPGYTDELGVRLLTQGGIKRDGTQLRLPMPRFRMTPEDAADVVAYLRSL
jgi:mono/diheme cytochrome c family protein